MYNNLVENCFDKCVMVGWGGVSDHNCYGISLVTFFAELHFQAIV